MLNNLRVLEECSASLCKALRQKEKLIVTLMNRREFDSQVSLHILR